MIQEIEWLDFKKVWEISLWPGRLDIEPQSAMLYLSGHDMNNFNLPVHYFGYFHDGAIKGVNSGHECGDGSYRSRGLWLDESLRGKGIGSALLKVVIEKGRERNSFCWSFPRKTSWPSYARAGFELTSLWQSSDTSSANAFCRLDY